ncbi:MAG: hypothetical protein ACE361_15290 [Aureliella sp.]
MIVALLILGTVQLVVGTGVLAGALLVTGEEAVTKDSLFKCAGITLASFLVSLLPFGGLLSIVVWFGAVMTVFEKELLEALLIAIACVVISFVIGLAITSLLGVLGLAA